MAKVVCRIEYAAGSKNLQLYLLLRLPEHCESFFLSCLPGILGGESFSDNVGLADLILLLYSDFK